MEYFASVTRKEGRSSEKRDYVLFLLGVLASAALSLVLKLLGI
jgi:hypothetical protein